MAIVVVSIRIMPESPDVDLSKIEVEAKKLMKEFGAGEDMRAEKKPVAFGLVALEMIFTMNESLGSTEQLENKISAVEGVNSVQVTDVRRAIG